MCYYGSSFPKGIKKDQGHFNLIADLHTLVRDAQQNLFHGEEGKKFLIAHLSKLANNVQKGDYDNKTEGREMMACAPEVIVGSH